MDNKRVAELKESLRAFKNDIDPKLVAKLDLEKCKRIIDRLTGFSIECEICGAYFTKLENHLLQLFERNEAIDQQTVKAHNQFIGEIETHLTEEHDLITSGYYTSIYMSLGMGIGLLFGLVVFDNIGFGLPIGLAIGVAIGAGKDADAKKKGKTI